MPSFFLDFWQELTFILEYACSTWAQIIHTWTLTIYNSFKNQISRFATSHTADTNNNNQSSTIPFIYQLHTYPYNPGPRFALIKPCRGGLPVGWVDRGFYRSPVNLRQVFELPRIWYYLRHNTTYYFLYTSKPTQNIQM